MGRRDFWLHQENCGKKAILKAIIVAIIFTAVFAGLVLFSEYRICKLRK